MHVTLAPSTLIHSSLATGALIYRGRERPRMPCLLSVPDGNGCPRRSVSLVHLVLVMSRVAGRCIRDVLCHGQLCYSVVCRYLWDRH